MKFYLKKIKVLKTIELYYLSKYFYFVEQFLNNKNIWHLEHETEKKTQNLIIIYFKINLIHFI
jgi:hypothetical protein